MDKPYMIVIGGSAGAIDALKKLVSDLPSDFPVALFIVVHIHPNAISVLPQILTRAGKLPAMHPTDGQKIQPGMIYCAPPDLHMLLQDGSIHLVRGPRVHGVRPAIDPLFTSAAQTYGSRVIGVLISGTLDDGTAGMIVISQNGGINIVQDPNQASYSGMPYNAIEEDHVTYILPISKISAMLVSLAQKPVDSITGGTKKGAKKMPDKPDTEYDYVKQDISSFESGQNISASRTILSCPDCGGLLWEFREGALLRYRCHVGHTYSDESYVSEQARSLESALWTAVRALEERSAVLRRLAARLSKQDRYERIDAYLRKAEAAEQSADVVRRLLLAGIDRETSLMNVELPDALEGLSEEMNDPEDASNRATDEPLD